MYLPKHFSQAEYDKVKNLIEENSFATILSFPKSNKPFINHLPIIFNSSEREEDVII